MTIINEAVSGVMDLIDAQHLFAQIRRGALGNETGIVCEPGASFPNEVYLDKNQYIPIDLTFNAKHPNLETATETMNTIHQVLTMLTTYPSGTGWQIVDITTATLPRVIGREDNGNWLVASAVTVKVYTESEVIHHVLLPYEGSYSVRSIANEEQTLDTDYRYMVNDMTVEEVYYSETGNDQGGYTVYIGE